MGTRKRRYRKCLDAVVQEVVHVPARLYESCAGQRNVKSYYKYLAWAYPIGQGTLPLRLLYLAGGGACNDQCC
jgi:hypothetical protein